MNGGIGYAYEYAGDAISAMSMEERMTICNMSIEGGALVGYVNPDQVTFDYIRGRQFAPKGEGFERAVKYWKSIASDANAAYDDEVEMDAGGIEQDNWYNSEIRASSGGSRKQRPWLGYVPTASICPETGHRRSDL